MLHEAAPDENPYWMETRDRNARTVRFAHFLRGYEHLEAIANVRLFTQQAMAFRRFAADSARALELAADAGVAIAMGKCLSTCAYAQLLAENCAAITLAPARISVIFHGLVEDLSAEALKLSAMFAPDSDPRVLLEQVSRIPSTSAAELEWVSAFIASRYQA